MSHIFTALFLSFFFNDTSTPKIYTLSLHDALPIYVLTAILGAVELGLLDVPSAGPLREELEIIRDAATRADRKSTRLNSSHGYISYAVFCLKKKKTT